MIRKKCTWVFLKPEDVQRLRGSQVKRNFLPRWRLESHILSYSWYCEHWGEQSRPKITSIRRLRTTQTAGSVRWAQNRQLNMSITEMLPLTWTSMYQHITHIKYMPVHYQLTLTFGCTHIKNSPCVGTQGQSRPQFQRQSLPVPMTEASVHWTPSGMWTYILRSVFMSPQLVMK